MTNLKKLLTVGGLMAVVLWVPMLALATEQPAAIVDDNAELTITGQAKFYKGLSGRPYPLLKTVEAAEALVDEYPQDPYSHFELAAQLSRTNYLERALQEVKIARDLLVEQQDPGFIQQMIGEYEAQVLRNPSNSKNSSLIWYRLALAYYLKGYALEKPKYQQLFAGTTSDTPSAMYVKSKQAFERVLKSNPKDVPAKNYLGYVFYKHDKNMAQANKLWQESLKIEANDNMAAYFLLANAAKERGDIAGSIIYGAKALEIKSRLGL